MSKDGDIRARRIVADHIKASVMMMADGVLPSNKLQGYVLRRLIRRAMLYGKKIGVDGWGQLVEPVGLIYKDAYPDVVAKAEEIRLIIEEEVLRFGRTLERGLREAEKSEKIDGKSAFYLYESFGFPWEMTQELAREKGQAVDREDFEQEFKEHQQK